MKVRIKVDGYLHRVNDMNITEWLKENGPADAWAIAKAMKWGVTETLMECALLRQEGAIRLDNTPGWRLYEACRQ